MYGARDTLISQEDKELHYSALFNCLYFEGVGSGTTASCELPVIEDLK